jgi:hypothetical protein
MTIEIAIAGTAKRMERVKASPERLLWRANCEGSETKVAEYPALLIAVIRDFVVTLSSAFT